jgi:hypothetical protein
LQTLQTCQSKGANNAAVVTQLQKQLAKWQQEGSGGEHVSNTNADMQRAQAQTRNAHRTTRVVTQQKPAPQKIHFEESERKGLINRSIAQNGLLSRSSFPKENLASMGKWLGC